jgi:hypothetical protein
MLRFVKRIGLGYKHSGIDGLLSLCRPYSTSGSVQRIEVPIGGNGSIDLNITPAAQGGNKNSKVVISLPPGLLNARNDGASRISDSVLLANHPSTTLINLNYRLSEPFQKDPKEKFGYPQPIHDCSIAFSHILTDIIPALFPHHPPREAWGPLGRPKIGLMGTHLGASLATMLALTNPNDIDAVAIADPMVDWVMLDEVISNSRQTRSAPSNFRGKRAVTPAMSMDEDIVSAARHLINMRTKLFTTPSAYFDGFASPTLFLRAPGRDTPRTHAEALGLLDAEDDGIQDFDVANDGWEAIGGADSYSPTPQTPPLFATETDQDTITEAIGTDSFGPYDDDLSVPHDATHPDSLASTSVPTLSTSNGMDSATSTTAPAPPSDASSIPPSATTDTLPSNSPPPPSPPTNPSDPDPSPSPPKRRKVLRRWPPNGPADTLLPYFNVYISPSPPDSSPSPPTPSPSSASPPSSPSVSGSASGSTSIESIDRGIHGITSLQAKELVDLLRRACFYGREKGVSEERVQLIDMGKGDGDGLREEIEAKDRNQMTGEEGKEIERERELMRRMVDWLEERL